MRLPLAYDPATKQQSFRLLSAYVSFVLCIASLVALHIWPQLLIATTMTMLFAGLNMVFFMLKKLSSAKIDLDDQSIELDSGPDEDSDAQTPKEK